MATEHKFHYLLKPGSDFKFVARMRLLATISLALCGLSIGMLFINKSTRGDYMNWTIDFKGGTEIVYKFVDKNDPEKQIKPDASKVRKAIADLGVEGFDVSEFSWKDEKNREINGMMVRTPRFGALSDQQNKDSVAQIETQLADRGLEKVGWSGDRLFVRSTQEVTQDQIAGILGPLGLELKPLEEGQAKLNATANEDTGEYNAVFTVYGIDRQYETAIEGQLGDADVQIVQSTGVGAKAGDKLRNDGIKSLFYAMMLIMLYLAFRFDIRYAPGAIVALLHDAIMVIGVFAVTWTEVSLTTVAALLTVIGYSVNDTVIIFDRIRENMVRLKDKKIERIVDISLNETLVRSILTSTTLFATTLMMNIFGAGLVKNFAFALNVGVIAGTYSSIFLASPLFLWIHQRWYSKPSKRGRRAAAA